LLWLLTLCSRVVNLIKYPLMPKQFKFFDFQHQNVLLLTFWLCRLVSYTCRQTHSQNGAWENDKSRDRGSNRVTEKTTLVVARLRSVKYYNNPQHSLLWVLSVLRGIWWHSLQWSVVGNPIKLFFILHYLHKILLKTSLWISLLTFRNRASCM
jgi:hypothetical protein